MRRFGRRFVALGEIADNPLRRQERAATPSSCRRTLRPRCWPGTRATASSGEHAGGAPRRDVESGKLRIIKAGDGSVHPIEAKYLAPEVHSLMKVNRPVVRPPDLDRVVLLVSEPMDKLKAKSPWVWRYIRYGMTATFRVGEIEGGPRTQTVHMRSTRSVVRPDGAGEAGDRILADGAAVPAHHRGQPRAADLQSQSVRCCARRACRQTRRSRL